MTEYLVFDTETTGVDVFNDRIVQLFIGLYDENGDPLNTWEWIINPGVEVPEGAAEVHGFTTDFLVENGVDPKIALTEALEIFEEYLGNPWVAYNINFDLSILDAEFKRHGLAKSWGQETANVIQLIDPLVIDRAKDKFRKGKRTLEAVAPYYHVAFDPEQAHKADYDVEITARVAIAVINRYGIPTNQQQAHWYKSWAVGLQEYLRRTDPEATVDGQWPVRIKEG